MHLSRGKLMQKKEREWRETKRIRSWSCSIRIIGTALLEQTIGVCHVRPCSSFTICFLEDLSSCAAYRRVFPTRGYVVFPEAQELKSLRLITLFTYVCAPSSAPSCQPLFCINGSWCQHQFCIAHHTQFRDGWEATSLTSMPFLSM